MAAAVLVVLASALMMLGVLVCAVGTKSQSALGSALAKRVSRTVREWKEGAALLDVVGQERWTLGKTQVVYRTAMAMAIAIATRWRVQ